MGRLGAAHRIRRVLGIVPPPPVPDDYALPSVYDSEGAELPAMNVDALVTHVNATHCADSGGVMGASKVSASRNPKVVVRCGRSDFLSATRVRGMKFKFDLPSGAITLS